MVGVAQCHLGAVIDHDGGADLRRHLQTAQEDLPVQLGVFAEAQIAGWMDGVVERVALQNGLDAI